MQHVDLSSGVDIGTQLGVTEKYLDCMYGIAVKYYENHRINDAMKIARQLILIESSNCRNYKLYAACFQSKNDYESAIRIYQNAIALSILDAEIYFYVGQCYFLLKEFDQASKSLQFAKTICEKNPTQWTHIYHHVSDLQSRASQRLTQPTQ